MSCLLCKGDMIEGTTTYFAELDNCVVIIKNVPCLKCRQCGETAFTGTVVRKIEEIEQAVKASLTEIAVINYSDKVA